MNIQKELKSSKIFECIYCDYITSRKSQYERHCLTDKHKKVTNNNNKNPTLLCCNNCDKKYNSRMGLWRHKNNCKKNTKYIPDNNIEGLKNTITNSISIFEIIKQNNDFKELLVQQSKYIHEQYKEQFEKIQEQHNEHIVKIQEQNKEQLEIINKIIEREPMQIINNNQINNNNQKFNLNIFLNETCKDAMNVTEFLDNLNPTVKDLEDVGEKGFVRGISDIILKGLRELDITKRPIHCTDIKREIVYLKENNIWSKDDNNNSRMKNIVRNVEDKNYFNIGKWQMEHPETRIMDSPDNLKHEKLIDVSCYAMYKEDKVRGKVIKELLKDIHVNGK